MKTSVPKIAKTMMGFPIDETTNVLYRLQCLPPAPPIRHLHANPTNEGRWLPVEGAKVVYEVWGRTIMPCQVLSEDSRFIYLFCGGVYYRCRKEAQGQLFNSQAEAIEAVAKALRNDFRLLKTQRAALKRLKGVLS